MKIYTKTGDQGKTGLYGGKRVEKHHARIEAYGDIDELNANLGHLRDLIDIEQDLLQKLQSSLFDIGSHLATPMEATKQLGQLPTFDESLVEKMEMQMDQWDEELPKMTHFILPGGHPHVSYCHIVRTICRRVERRISALGEQIEINPWVLIFINRLSDYLFTMARKLTLDYQADEVRWIANNS